MTVTGYEQLAVVVAGAAAAMAGFLGAGVHPPVLAIVLFVAALAAAVAARPAFVGGWLHERLQARGIETAGPLRGRTLALMVAVDAAGWVATGLGAWALARALGATAGLDAFLLLGAFALSWLLGVLVPLAPGGLGLREGSLILSLGAAVGAGPATALALALRLVSFAGELVAIGVAELAALAFARRASAAPAAAPTPTPRALPRREPHRHDRRRPDLLRGRRPPPLRRALRARPASSCSWSTTPRPTATGGLADALAAERPWMHVLHRAGKDGLGMAYRAGFGWCLERGYRVIGQMDSDLSHPPEKLAEMLAVLDARDADLVLGNRYMPGGGTARLVEGPPRAQPHGLHRLEARPRPALRRPQRRLQAVAREHARRARLRLDALHRLRLPGRDDPARLPDGQAHRGGPLRLQRAHRGRVEDDARGLAGGHPRDLRAAPEGPRPPRGPARHLTAARRVAPWASSAARPAMAAKQAVTTAKACVGEPEEARLR